MRRLVSIFVGFLALISSFLVTATARAADLIPDPNNQGSRITQNQPGTSLNSTLGIFTDRISNVVFLLIGGAAVILIVLAGIQYISSAGNPDQIKKARQSIINIVLGVIVLTATYYIVRLLIGAAGAIVP